MSPNGWSAATPAAGSARTGGDAEISAVRHEPVQGNLNGLKFYDEAYLVEDITDYKSDRTPTASRKVITLLFYLPKDESQLHLGTSIYVPKDRNFRCEGGPHYPFDWFERMATMPFQPNSLFTFVKGDASFHGVEPVRDADCKRWLLLFDVFMEQVPVQTLQQPGGQAPATPRSGECDRPRRPPHRRVPSSRSNDACRGC